MRKILIILGLLISINSFAQDDTFFWSYTHSQAYDTIKIMGVNQVSPNYYVYANLYTYSGDSVLFRTATSTVKVKTRIGSVMDSNFTDRLKGVKLPNSYTGYIITKRNDFKGMFISGVRILDLSQARLMTELRTDATCEFISSNVIKNNKLLSRINIEDSPVVPGVEVTLDVSNNSLLKYFYRTEASGTIYGMNGLILPSSQELYEVSITRRIQYITFGDLNPNIHYFYAHGNLSQSEVDKILKYFVDSARNPNNLGTNGQDQIILCLPGNAIPSSVGIDYTATLISRGWIVCTNTPPANPPSVSTLAATMISTTSATLNGSVTGDSGSTVTSRGICWSTSLNPTVANSHIDSGTGIGNFSVNATGLTANTLYHFRAYANNANGIAYGEDLTFTTTSAIQTVPELTTTAPTGITTTSANSGGTIKFDGNYEIIEKGVCWNTSGTPTYNDSKTNDGSGTTSYSSSVVSLSPNTTYYLRAYARNRKDAGGSYVYATGYGQEEIFKTASSSECNLPTITTNVVNTITENSVIGGGNVTDDGGCGVISKGSCWSINPNPTIANSKTTDGSGTGSFTSNITGLSCGTNYFIRAYATNSSGTVYGNSITFSTEVCTYIPTVSLNTITKYGDTYATFSGSVTSDGNSTVTERGFVYSTLPNPTTSSSKITAGTGTGLFTANAYGLVSNTKYYVRSYAINSIGTAYSDQLDFTTLTSASVVSISTSITIDITTSTATLGGNISSDGGNTVTERGVVYGLSINPTTSNTKIQSGDGIGIYSVNVTGLTQGTTYHVRAYAINSNGTFYGADESFITSIDGATACNAGQTFPGGQSYPSTNTIVLGSGTGDVTLTFSAYDRPDFFLVEYNSTIYNSGWRGSSIYDYGGNSRSAFKSALWGKIDPTNPSFPTTFPNTTLYPEDGYPRVNSTVATGSISFTKSTSNPTTATVKVYAPMSDTYWTYILSCPN